MDKLFNFYLIYKAFLCFYLLTKLGFSVIVYTKMACLIKKKIYGRTYYYAGVSKRVNGKPRIVNLRYLGTADSIIKRLTEPPLVEPKEVDTLRFGAPAALWHQAKEIGLVEIINEVIPQRGNREISVGEFITVGAINRAINPCSKNGIGKWMNKTVLPRLIGRKARSFDSQSFWDAMELVKEEHIMRIEEKVWERVLKLYNVFTDTIFYDTTNFATHIDAFTSCQIPQRGKPKKGGKEQRLVGLALAASKVLGLPFLHIVYEGNIHDANLFPSAMSLLVERFERLSKVAKNLTIVFDKGNNSEKNLETLDKMGSSRGIKVSVVGSLKPSHYPEFLKVPLDKFREKVGDYKVYRTESNLFGKRRVVLVTFYEDLYKRQYRSFMARIKRVKEEIMREFNRERRRSRYKHRDEILLSRYEKMLEKKKLKGLLRLKIKGSSKRELKIEINKREFKRRVMRFGRTIIFSDHIEWSSEEIINTYHRKHINEENFKFLKMRHYLYFEPVYHWTDQKIRVHALMCVLGLLLVKLLFYKAKTSGIEMSIPVLLDELNDIEEVTMLYSDGRIKKMIKKLSTVQSKLFELFNLKEYEDTS